MRADCTARAAYYAVKAALAASGGSCAGAAGVASHNGGLWRRGEVPVAHGGAEELPRLGLHGGRQGGRTFVGALYRLPGRRLPSSGAPSSAARSRAETFSDPGGLPPVRRVKAPFGRSVTFPKRKLKPGYYAYGLRLTAEMNPARTFFAASPVFRLGRLDRAGKRSASEAATETEGQALTST